MVLLRRLDIKIWIAVLAVLVAAVGLYVAERTGAEPLDARAAAFEADDADETSAFTGDLNEFTNSRFSDADLDDLDDDERAVIQGLINAGRAGSPRATINALNAVPSLSGGGSGGGTDPIRQQFNAIVAEVSHQLRAAFANVPGPLGAQMRQMLNNILASLGQGPASGGGGGGGGGDDDGGGGGGGSDDDDIS